MSYAKSDKNEAREMATTMRAVNKLLAVNTQCLPPDYLEVSIGEFVHTVADRAKRADALRPRSKKRKEDSKVSSSKNPVVTTAAELASNLAKQMRGLKGKMDAEKAERFTEVLREIRAEIENVAKVEAESEEASDKPKKRRKTRRFGGYQEFCKMERKNFDPDTTKLMDQTKILGARWSEMSDKQKAPFEAKANAAREAYLADLAMNPPPLESDDGKKKKKKKSKNKKFSGYLAFCDEKRDTLEKGLKVPEQARKLGEMWKALSDEKREKYATKAAKAKAVYEAERAANPDPEESEDEGEEEEAQEDPAVRRIPGVLQGDAPQAKGRSQGNGAGQAARRPVEESRLEGGGQVREDGREAQGGVHGVHRRRSARARRRRRRRFSPVEEQGDLRQPR